MIAAAILLVSLSVDTLAVAAGLGLGGLPRSQWRRVGLTFALFEGLMPIIGLLLGRQLSVVASVWAEYLAAGLLILVGALAIREALLSDDDDDEKEKRPVATLAGKQLFLLGLSVSLDELAVGFSIGALHLALASALAYIAIQALIITFVGLAIGARLGKSFGERAELVSGIVLTLLGVALLINRATGSHFL